MTLKLFTIELGYYHRWGFTILECETPNRVRSLFEISLETSINRTEIWISLFWYNFQIIL
jgi:hypothetical protein